MDENRDELTVMDIFAMAAMMQLANNKYWNGPTKEQSDAGMTWANITAIDCYDMAEAMMKERSKRMEKAT